MPFWDQRDDFGDSNLLVVKPEECRSLALALGPHSTVLMRRHGATVVGANVRELVFRSIAMRFVEGYRESVDWMYADPKAIELYAQKMKLDQGLIADSIKEFHPKAAMQTDEMRDLDGIQRDAVKLKFIDAPLSKEQLAELIQIPPRKK